MSTKILHYKVYDAKKQFVKKVPSDEGLQPAKIAKNYAKNFVLHNKDQGSTAVYVQRTEKEKGKPWRDAPQMKKFIITKEKYTFKIPDIIEKIQKSNLLTTDAAVKRAKEYAQNHAHISKSSPKGMSKEERDALERTELHRISLGRIYDYPGPTYQGMVGAPVDQKTSPPKPKKTGSPKKKKTGSPKKKKTASPKKNTGSPTKKKTASPKKNTGSPSKKKAASPKKKASPGKQKRKSTASPSKSPKRAKK